MRFKKSDGTYEDIPVWQLPFRYGASLLLMGIPIVLAAGGFLLSISTILWFFGARESIWPPWPFE